jgi:CheY-like chemotaxis protein
VSRILIVEDDLKIASLYKETLEKEGNEVKISADIEALNIIKAEKPDLVLLDILMPKVNGLTILREIKTTPELEGMPVIILTNVEGADELSQAITLGASGYLVKAETSLDMLSQKVKDVTQSGSMATGVKG